MINESPLDYKEIKPVNPKGNQSWMFIGRLMLKLKLQHFGHLMRTDSLEKTLMLGKIEGRRRGWDRMRWMASLTRWHEFEQTPKLVMDREAWCAVVQRVVAWGHKELGTTEQLHWTELNHQVMGGCSLLHPWWTEVTGPYVRSVYFAYLYIKNHKVHVTLTLIPSEPVTLEQAVSKLTSCTLLGIGLKTVSIIKDHASVFTIASPLEWQRFDGN